MSVDEYHQKLNKYFTYLTQERLIVEITKCCGYEQIQMFYKNSTLDEIYQDMTINWCNAGKFELFVLDVTGIRLDIPKGDTTTTLREFINKNRDYFIPIYPLPSSVVYRIYLDDGHTHTHANNINNDNNNNNNNNDL